jgi:pilus assembly protein CpaF
MGEQLVGLDALAPNAWEFLRACVVARLNILIAGADGAANTALLYALCDVIPPDELVAIFGEPRLDLDRSMLIRLMPRPPAEGGEESASFAHLVEASRWIGVDRIILERCTEFDARDYLLAMGSRWEGTLATLAADSPAHAFQNLEQWSVDADPETNRASIREKILSGVNMVVHVGQSPEGSGRVRSVSEPLAVTGDGVTLQDILLPNENATRDRAATALRTVFARPKLLEKLLDAGYRDPERFLPEVI